MATMLEKSTPEDFMRSMRRSMASNHIATILLALGRSTHCLTMPTRRGDLAIWAMQRSALRAMVREISVERDGRLMYNVPILGREDSLDLLGREVEPEESGSHSARWD
jgi:hypothetical protein